MNILNFNDFYWHDAVLKSIAIDRNNPGVIDELKLNIKWPDLIGNSTIVFEDVYRIIMKLNMAIVSDETILHAFSKDESDEDIVNLYKDWKGQLYDIELTAYTIELNSTGGVIKIISKGFREDKM